MHWLHLLSAIHITSNDVGLPNSTQNLGDATSKVVKALIYLVGSLSVIFIIVGGIQLAVSGGDPTGVQKGRNTVLYAAIGVIVAISAFAIVSFIGGKL